MIKKCQDSSSTFYIILLYSYILVTYIQSKTLKVLLLGSSYEAYLFPVLRDRVRGETEETLALP